MKLIDRYILRELIASFLIGLLLFTFVLMMGKVLHFTELLITRGVGVQTVLTLFLYLLPYSLMVTIPLAALLALLAVYSRLSSEGEVIALHVSGLSLRRLMVPGLILGVAAYLITSVITLAILPKSNRAFKELVFRLARSHATFALQEGVFTTPVDGVILYVEQLEGGSTLKGILLMDGRDPKAERVVIAQQGAFLPSPDGQGLTLRLSNGTLHLSTPDQSDRYRLAHFDSLDFSLLKGNGAGGLNRTRGDQEMTLGELRARISRLKVERGNFRPFQVEFHRRLAIPFTSLVFVLIGVPLGIRLKKGGRGGSLALSLGFALFYYILIVAGEDLGDRGKIPPAVAMWTPNLFLGLLGVCLVLVEEQALMFKTGLFRWRKLQISTPKP
ncbi:MAG: LPS export ABC transporter permease LptF [candidate division NC10 bacterium]|nr:LPS export ABC transporter permease LptF [candidate division NC10 bacterium]